MGNLLTISLFAVNKDLRKKSLVLVINMAFADLMLGAILMPFDIYLYTGDRYLLWTANSSTSLYIFHEIVAVVLYHASLISAAFLSGERLYTILWPLKHRTLSMRAYTVFVHSYSLDSNCSCIHSVHNTTFINFEKTCFYYFDVIRLDFTVHRLRL